LLVKIQQNLAKGGRLLFRPMDRYTCNYGLGRRTSCHCRYSLTTKISAAVFCHWTVGKYRCRLLNAEFLIPSVLLRVNAPYLRPTRFRIICSRPYFSDVVGRVQVQSGPCGPHDLYNAQAGLWTER